MAMPEIDEVKDLAIKYDKPTLGRLAQMGQISPTLAVMAGMMRDRVVQSEMKPPSPPTVAEEVMQPMGQRMGLAAAAQPQTGLQPPPSDQRTGINQVPVPPQMFERRGMAGGGIVAFEKGGKASLPEILKMMSMQELQYYQRTGRLPEKYRTMLQGAEPTFSESMEAQERGVPSSSIGEPMAPTPSQVPRATPLTSTSDAIDLAQVPLSSDTMSYYPGMGPALQRQATDKAREITDVAYVPPEVFAAQQAEAKERDAAPPQIDQFSGTQTFEGAPVKVPEGNQPLPEDKILAEAETKETADDIYNQIMTPRPRKDEKKRFDLATEAKAIDEARAGFVGEDPYTKYLTEQLEKGGKENFTDRALRALQMIQAGEQIREGRAGAETALPTLLKQRQADVAAKEGRAEKMAQLKGREYERKGKAFETALGKREKIEGEERAAATRADEAERGYQYKAKLVRLAEREKPEDYRLKLTNILLDPEADPILKE